MSIHNVRYELMRALAVAPKEYTATPTDGLTHEELLQNFRFNGEHASTGIVLTLPVPDEALEGCINIFTNTGAATLKITVLEGFGGAGTSYDYVTLAEGEFLITYCSRDQGTTRAWHFYTLHHTAAGSS